MRMNKLLFVAFVTVLFVGVASGCKGGGTSTPDAISGGILKNLTIKDEKGNVPKKRWLKGEGLQLVAVREPSNAIVDLEWQSGDETKARVNELGYVTFENAGGVAIKVTDKKTNISGSFDFEVEEQQGEEDSSIKIRDVAYHNNGGWSGLNSIEDRVFEHPEIATTKTSVSIKLRVRPENPSMVDRLMFKLNENGLFTTVNKNNVGNYEITCNDVKGGDNVIIMRLIAGSKYNEFKVKVKVTVLECEVLPDKDFDINKVKGEKLTILIFSQDTCSACDAAYRHSVPLYNKYHSKGLNVILFMKINSGSDHKTIAKMLEYKIPYPCYKIEESPYVMNIWQDVQSTPYVCIIKDDKIVFKDIYNSSHNSIEKFVKENCK